MTMGSVYTGFTNLPNEILKNIAEKLYDYDWEIKYANWTCEPELRSCRADLARFALLDKHIYEIAIKTLYEKVEVRTSNARPLLETMLQNEKLAGLVREVCLNFSVYEDEMNDAYHENQPLTVAQKTIFAKAMNRGPFSIQGFRFHNDRDDLDRFFEGESPTTEAGILLYALPNLTHLRFGRENCTTFDATFGPGKDMPYSTFRKCIYGIFSQNPADRPAAMLSLESFTYAPPSYKEFEHGVWRIDNLAPFFFCPKIRSIELSGARSLYPYGIDSEDEYREGNPPLHRPLDPLLLGYDGSDDSESDERQFVEIDSDGEEDGLNGECHKCLKKESEIHGKLKRCMKCKKRVYCSKECQTGDWPTHKKACRVEKPHHRFPYNIKIGEPGSSSLEIKPASSSLEILSLRETDLHPKVLRKILSQPRALKSFTYVSYGFEKVWEEGTHLPMKPTLFQLALEAQQKSLEKLEIELILEHQESLMNLCHFTSLTDLKIEVLLLTWRPSLGLKIPLCDKLPASLKSLTLDFSSWCIRGPRSNIEDDEGWKDLDENVYEALEFHLRGVAASQRLERLRIVLPRVSDLWEKIPQGWKATVLMAEELFRPLGTELVVQYSYRGTCRE